MPRAHLWTPTCLEQSPHKRCFAVTNTRTPNTNKHTDSIVSHTLAFCVCSHRAQSIQIKRHLGQNHRTLVAAIITSQTHPHLPPSALATTTTTQSSVLVSATAFVVSHQNTQTHNNKRIHTVIEITNLAPSHVTFQKQSQHLGIRCFMQSGVAILSAHQHKHKHTV